MNRFLTFLFIVATMLSYSCKENQSSSDIEIVTPEEMQQISEIEDVQLIDVRTPNEYNQDYIENFQNIDYLSPDFDQEIEKLDKSKPVLVYCKSGNLRNKCVVKMKKKGFVKVYDLDSEIAKWEFKGFDGKTSP
jgi:rhodanese-related sulfurtransferase